MVEVQKCRHVFRSPYCQCLEAEDVARFGRAVDVVGNPSRGRERIWRGLAKLTQQRFVELQPYGRLIVEQQVPECGENYAGDANRRF